MIPLQKRKYIRTVPREIVEEMVEMDVRAIAPRVTVRTIMAIGSRETVPRVTVLRGTEAITKVTAAIITTVEMVVMVQAEETVADLIRR